MNSLFNELGQAQGNSNIPNLNNLKNVMKRLQALQNPTESLSDLAKQNPSIKQALEMAQNKHMSLKDLFYFLAKEKGVNPDDIINSLK